MSANSSQSVPAKRSPKKDRVIQIRASTETKTLLSRAAALRGWKLSEFILDCAQRQAEETLLDQRVFSLDAGAYEAFLKLLDHPTKPNAKLAELMDRRAPWET